MEEIVKILVVDDDEVDRMAVRRALKTAGVKMEMSEAEDCAEAISTLQQQEFDCVFLDYRLPDGDGLNLVQDVRSLEIQVPMIVLTGQGDEQIAVQLMKAGASDYLSKNKISPDNLSQILRQAIRIYKAEREAAIANQKLKESEERYRLVLEGSNDGIWDWYCTTDQVFCNDRLLEIIGVSRAEFNPTTDAFVELIHPEDLVKVQAAIKSHLTIGAKCEVEFRMRHSCGEYRYCFAKGRALRDKFGCPVRMSGVISDISERKRLEQALRASEARFRRLAESNVIGMMVANQQGEIIEANDAFLKMLGYKRWDLEPRKLRWQEITPPQYREIDERATAELLKAGIFSAYEKEYIRKDSSHLPVLIGGALVEGLEKTAICFVLDLSERKQAEAEIVKLNRDLQRRVTELETLLDVIPIGIAIAPDPECSYLRVNAPLAKLLQLPSGATASKSAHEQEQPGYRVYRNGTELLAEELPMQSAAQQGVEVLNTEIDVVVREGEPTIKLLANTAPLFDEQGKPRGSIGAFIDITERKRIEEQERFLAEASALLATSLDYQTTLESLGQLITPQLADWCTIHVVENDQSLRLVTVSHADPTKREWAIALQRRYPVNPNAPCGTAGVIKSGQSEFYPQIPNSLFKAIAQDSEHIQVLQNLGLKSLICVPMKARGRTLGAISFAFDGSGRTYTPADLALAEDVARRAGLAVDNARLYREATEIGENLRQAILILGEQQQQLRVLQRLTNLLNQRLTDLPGLLQMMVRAVGDAIDGAQFCLIVLHNPQTNKLELTATSGAGGENLHISELTNTESGLLGQVFATGVSQLFQKGTGAEESISMISLRHFRFPAAVYAVAIESAQAGRLGVLAIGNWENRDAFDLEDRNLLGAVGEQAAIAINNARMIVALEEREERLAMQNDMLAKQNRQLELNRQQIQFQNLQLLEAARLKSQFLATMSHELRTPLNAILGFAQVLLRQRTASLSDHQVEMAQRILSNGNNLLALINDILDLAKIEAGRLSLQLEEINITTLVMATIADHRPLAEEKSLDLRWQINLNNSQVVNDPGRLKQVLINLISNAIKFTSTGTVEVKVWELPKDRIAIAVQDTGIGIADGDIKDIFEKFRQIDQGITRKHGGTGLGLAITKSLIEMMQGEISVESKVGEGSTFCVELPRKVPDRWGNDSESKPSTKSSTRMLF